MVWSRMRPGLVPWARCRRWDQAVGVLGLNGPPPTAITIRVSTQARTTRCQLRPAASRLALVPWCHATAVASCTTTTAAATVAAVSLVIGHSAPVVAVHCDAAGAVVPPAAAVVQPPAQPKQLLARISFAVHCAVRCACHSHMKHGLWLSCNSTTGTVGGFHTRRCLKLAATFTPLLLLWLPIAATAWSIAPHSGFAAALAAVGRRCVNMTQDQPALTVGDY